MQSGSCKTTSLKLTARKWTEYEQGKKQEAFDHATESLGGGFAENNAMIALLFTAMEHQDGGTVNAVVAKMQEISLTLENGVDKTYLDKILENLK